jgi:hypothetical protein
MNNFLPLMIAGKLHPIYNSDPVSVHGLAQARWWESMEIAILFKSVFIRIWHEHK